MEPSTRAVRRIQRTTITGVLLLAAIAAVVSFRHIHELCLRHGEDRLAAVLIPLAVDGTIVVASMSILLANRYGSRGGFLAWTMLLVGSLASLGANIAVAEPSLIGRLIAAWPSAALIGSYELLMSQVRLAAVRGRTVGQWEVADDRDPVGDDDPDSCEGASLPVCETEDLRQVAWRWALANRLPDGALPSGRVIAEQFARSERSGKSYRIEARHVDVDLWAFHRALADARKATDEEIKTVALEEVARLCRGQLGQGLRYDWLDQDHRWPLTVASVKAFLQLGAFHERAGRNERALEVFDQACVLDPDMESAARAAIRLLLELGRTDEARLRARHLKARLTALGVPASPTTEALFDRMNRHS